MYPDEETEEDLIPENMEKDPGHQVQPDLDGDRLMGDPGHFPLQPPDPAPLYRHLLFLQARRRHEFAEGPSHVQRRKFLERGTGENADEAMLVDDATDMKMKFSWRRWSTTPVQ